MDECRKQFNEWANNMQKDQLMLTAFSAWKAAWDSRTNQWQPIETAPKDGTEFLAWNNGTFCDGYVDFCMWSIDHWQQPDAEVGGVMTPTRWMPLPDAPKCKNTI